MNKRLLLEIIIGIIIFVLGLLLGFHLFYQNGCSKCSYLSNDGRETYTEEDLIEKYNITFNAYSGIKQNGYTLNWKGTYYLLTIAMGERKTGGYSLVVQSVTETKDNIIIVVSENTPNIKDIVTQAFTTPAITMHVKSQNVIVKTDKGNIYQVIK